MPYRLQHGVRQAPAHAVVPAPADWPDANRTAWSMPPSEHKSQT